MTRKRQRNMLAAALFIAGAMGSEPAQGFDAPLSIEAIERLIENGQPEYATRAMSEAASTYDVGTRRRLYTQALEFRLKRGEEGAVMDLLLHPVPGAEDRRPAIASALAEQWRSDETPTLRDLRRRLSWYARLQRAIRPAPLEPELPITLILVALDHVDRVDAPEDLFTLLELADRVSPNDRLWTSYRPDRQYRLYAAEALAKRGRFLDAEELFRRLVFDVPERADWFRRKLARTQVDRVTAVADLVGAAAALRAASMVRSDFLNEDERSLFRLQEARLYKTVADYQGRRRLPLTVAGVLELEPLPVSYTISDETYIGADARLSFGPGTVVRGGRMVLEGGEVEFNGTAEEPVIVIGVTFAADDQRGGGRITGENVQFRDCRWRRGITPPVDGATRWEMRLAYSVGCQWRFDSACRVTWTESEFVDSLVFLESTPDGPSIDPFVLRDDPDAGFGTSLFIDCVVDQAVVIGGERCGFIDGEFEWTSADPLSPRSDVAVIRGFYEPAGGLPSLINRTARFAEGTGPIDFETATAPPFVGLGRVRWWVD